MKKLLTKEMGIKVGASVLGVVAMGVPALAADFQFSMPTIMSNILIMMMYAFMAIGVVTIVFGAIQMGFAFKNDDADGKTKGMRSALAGVIVFAVGLAGSSFFNGTGSSGWWTTQGANGL